MKTTLVLLGFFSFTYAYANEYADRQSQSTPDSVLQWLKQGNERFANGLSEHGGISPDARTRIQLSGVRQHPLAAVLSCIDSRTAPEVVFDTSVGDLFTVRVAGNVINPDILGSLEISVASGVKTIVVLGHKDCGAIKGACHDFEFGHLTQLLNRVKPAIAETHAMLDEDREKSRQVGERDPSNRKYIAAISHTHARRSTQKILQRSEFLKEKVESGEIKILTALYDVETGQVEWSQ